MKETKYIMKKKTISLMIATVLIMGNSVQAFAEPSSTSLDEGRKQYEDIQNKISDIQTKLDELNNEMEKKQSEIDSNKKETEEIKNVIDNTQKDIDQCKKDITDLDEALGQRVSAMYKSGNLEFSYLNYILESKSTSDFFQKLQNLSTLVGKDKKSINKVTDKKKELNDKVTTLEDKKKEKEDLAETIKKDITDLDDKKDKQEELANEAKEERDKFDSETLAVLERADIEPMYASITSDKSSAELTTIINSLQNTMDKVVKSPIVKEEIAAQIKKATDLRDKKKKEEEEAAAKAAQQEQQEQQASQSSQSSSSSSSSPNRGGNGGGNSTPSYKAPAKGSGNASAVVSELNNHLGKAYVWGATGPNNFDCSGLVQYVYRVAAGVNLPRTTYEQLGCGTAVSQADLQPGDLVFPHTGHVGIYIGGGQMIHAPQTGDVVKISSVYKFYTARRIL